MGNTPKVFCIGFMKTGTTTMNRALGALGYRVSPHSWKLLKPIMRKDWDKVKQHIEAYDAFEDNPIPQIFKELDGMFPDSKFILTVRESESWYKSVAHHIEAQVSPMHEWVFGRGKSIPAKDKAHTIRVFEEHNAAVVAYFKDRPNDLLVYDVKEHTDWKSLCDFLDKPIPAADYPHANRSDYSKPKYDGKRWKWRRIRKRLRYPLVIFYYNLRGWIPTR